MARIKRKFYEDLNFVVESMIKNGSLSEDQAKTILYEMPYHHQYKWLSEQIYRSDLIQDSQKEKDSE